MQPCRVSTQRHNLKFKTVSMEFKDEDTACAWIIMNQFGRRNLALFARAELALKLEPLLKPIVQAKAKAKVIVAKASEEVKALLRAGETTINVNGSEPHDKSSALNLGWCRRTGPVDHRRMVGQD